MTTKLYLLSIVEEAEGADGIEYDILEPIKVFKTRYEAVKYVKTPEFLKLLKENLSEDYVIKEIDGEGF